MSLSTSNSRNAQNFVTSLNSTHLVATLSEGAHAPTLQGLDVDQVLLFLRLWEKYVSELKEWCAINKKNINTVKVSMKSRVADITLMEMWAEVQLRMKWSEMTEEDFKSSLELITSIAVCNRSDVDALLKGKLKVDYSIKDPTIRMVQYFAHVKYEVLASGLDPLIKTNVAKSKKFCQLLVKHLSPASLKEDVEVCLKYDKYDDANKYSEHLFELVVECAKRQQNAYDYVKRYGLSVLGNGKRKQEDRDDGSHLTTTNQLKRQKFKEKNDFKRHEFKRQEFKNKPEYPKDKPAELAKLKVHLEGCLMCGGDHKLMEHEPRLSKAQSNHLWEAYYKEKGIPNPHRQQKKFLRKLFGEPMNEEDAEAPVFTVKINGVLEKPAILDTGARSMPAISQKWMDELLELDPNVEVEQLTTPIIFETAGGYKLVAKEIVKVKVDVQTVSGTITSYKPITCCIIDEDEQLFLITNPMLKSIGINVDKQLLDKAAQLAIPRSLVCVATHDGDDIINTRLEQPLRKEP